LIFLLYLFSIVKFIRNDDKYFSLALLFIGLGFQFESAFAVLLIPLTIFGILTRGKLPKIKYMLYGVLGFLTAVSSFLVFDLRHNFLMMSSAFKFFTNTHEPLPGYEQYANLGFRVMDRMQNLWASFFSPLYVKDKIVSVLLISFVLFTAAIVFKRIFYKENKSLEKEFLFIFLTPIIIFSLYILYPLPLWPHYLLPISVSFGFIVTLSIYVLWSKPILRPVIVIFLFLCLAPAFISVKAQLATFKDYTPNGDGSYLNQLQVARWVLSDSKNKDTGYFVYTPGILTYSMDYLFWWLTTSNGLDNLSSEKKENTYVIMYKPLEGDTSAHDFWKQKTLSIKNISPNFSSTFNGGIVVERYDLLGDQNPVDPNYYQNLIFR
jgi:hypothetical protein